MLWYEGDPQAPCRNVLHQTNSSKPIYSNEELSVSNQEKQEHYYFNEFESREHYLKQQRLQMCHLNDSICSESLKGNYYETYFNEGSANSSTEYECNSYIDSSFPPNTNRYEYNCENFSPIKHFTTNGENVCGLWTAQSHFLPHGENLNVIDVANSNQSMR